MVPYYILLPEKFNLEIKQFSTNQQDTISTTKNAEPITRFVQKSYKEFKNFIKYDLMCEVFHNQKGRAYGTSDIFQHCILIDEDVFYYDTINEIVYVSARKDVFKKFIQYINKNNESPFKFLPQLIDFIKIIDKGQHLGITGIWLGDVSDINLNCLAMMGDSVETCLQYKSEIKSGATVRNITLIYEYNGEQYRIMITKDGGIILYDSLDETDALNLVRNVYETFIK